MALNDSNSRGARGEPERDSRLDRLYREAGRDSPPARLDAAILAAARREVGAGPRPLLSRLGRWRVPMAIAAVVVLSVSLVTLVREETDERLLEIPPPSPKQPTEPQARRDPAQSARPQPRAAAPVPVLPERQDGSGGSLASDAAGKRAEDARREKATPPAGQGAGAPGSGDKARARLFRDVPPRARGDAFAGRAPEAAEKGGAADAARLSSPRLPAPMSERTAPEPPRAGAVTGSPQAAPAGPRGLPAWHDLEQAPPQKWVERIAELRRQERVAEAEAILAEFKRRFPDYPVAVDRN